MIETPKQIHPEILAVLFSVVAFGVLILLCIVWSHRCRVGKKFGVFMLTRQIEVLNRRGSTHKIYRSVGRQPKYTVQ